MRARVSAEHRYEHGDKDALFHLEGLNRRVAIATDNAYCKSSSDLRREYRLISFIVPAYDEENLLGATLDALHAAGKALNEPYELVVADDASTDRTATVAERHGARVVRVAHRQIAATRNSGARAAAGELFIFVDADTIVSEAVVRAAVDASSTTISS